MGPDLADDVRITVRDSTSEVRWPVPQFRSELIARIAAWEISGPPRAAHV
jgi:hypothetical protein